MNTAPLHQRMRWAATVLEEANTRCGGPPPQHPWTAAALLRESDVLESEENE